MPKPDFSERALHCQKLNKERERIAKRTGGLPLMESPNDPTKGDAQLRRAEYNFNLSIQLPDNEDVLSEAGCNPPIGI